MSILLIIIETTILIVFFIYFFINFKKISTHDRNNIRKKLSKILKVGDKIQIGENTVVFGDSFEKIDKEVGRISGNVKVIEDDSEKILYDINDLKKISNTIRSIEGIAKTLEEIANQTNILALNAKIESARVGESKGLNSVATEINKLAKNAGEASEFLSQTLTLTAEIKAAMGEIVSLENRISVNQEEIRKGQKIITDIISHGEME